MYQAHGQSPTARETAGPPAPVPGDPPSGAVRAGQIDTPARPPPSGAGSQPALVALASPSPRGISRRPLEYQCGTDAPHLGAILAVTGPRPGGERHDPRILPSVDGSGAKKILDCPSREGVMLRA